MKWLKLRPNLFKIRAKDGSILPFEFNKIQKIIFDKIEETQKKGKTRLIIVKGRQGGVTTLCQTLAHSYVLSVPAFKAYCMAHDRESMSKIFDNIIKLQYENFPDQFRNILNAKRNNVRELMFEGALNSSSISVGLSPRGTTVDFLHISEAGMMSMNSKLWNEMIQGALPSAEASKIIIIESTPDGGLGSFYKMVKASLEGENDFETLFIPWYWTDEYKRKLPKSDDWMEKYESLAKSYKLYSNPMIQFGITKEQFYWYYLKVREQSEGVKVQYPFTIEEAFSSNMESRFDIQKLKNTETLQPLRVYNGIKLYRQPEPLIYSMGIDSSRGRGDGDYSAFKLRAIINNRYVDVASYKGRINEEGIFHLAMDIANTYNQVGKVYITPEVNNMGLVLVNLLRDHYNNDLLYRRFITDVTKPRDSLEPDYGYYTSSKTRHYMINQLAQAFHMDELEVADPEQIDEMRVFAWSNSNRRFEALTGEHDDLVMADALCIQGFEYINRYG